MIATERQIRAKISKLTGCRDEEVSIDFPEAKRVLRKDTIHKTGGSRGTRRLASREVVKILLT